MLLEKMTDMTKQFIKDKPVSQWGISLDGTPGFELSSSTGTWQDSAKSIMMFEP
jgi:hypothetical protein